VRNEQRQKTEKEQKVNGFEADVGVENHSKTWN
jgi:hypothetical protein